MGIAQLFPMNKVWLVWPRHLMGLLIEVASVVSSSNQALLPHKGFKVGGGVMKPKGQMMELAIPITLFPTQNPMFCGSENDCTWVEGDLGTALYVCI